MDDIAKDHLADHEILLQYAIAIGLFAGWGLSATCFCLVYLFRDWCKDRRLRNVGTFAILVLIGMANLLVIQWA